MESRTPNEATCWSKMISLYSTFGCQATWNLCKPLYNASKMAHICWVQIYAYTSFASAESNSIFGTTADSHTWFISYWHARIPIRLQTRLAINLNLGLCLAASLYHFQKWTVGVGAITAFTYPCLTASTRSHRIAHWFEDRGQNPKTKNEGSFLSTSLIIFWLKSKV